MGEKRSNHTVYNVNYHFVWCPKSCKTCGLADLAELRSA